MEATSKRRIWAALVLVGAAGCAEDTLTAEERATLQAMRIGPPPASPTNSFADNLEAAQLGQQFFFDTRFSGPLMVDSAQTAGGLGPMGARGKVACVTCHDLERGGADSRPMRATSLGAKWGGRNTQTVVNAAHQRWMFWDGRSDSLWSQALSAAENPGAHNNTRLQVAHTIFTFYRQPYEKLFGPMPPLDDAARFPPEGRPTMPAYEGMAPDDKKAVTRVFVNYGKAIEAYERRLVDRSSPFDRFLDGDRMALSPEAVRGAKLFVGRAACNECHSGPMLSDDKFHNHGVPQVGATVPMMDLGRETGIPKYLADEFNGASAYSDTAQARMGDLQAAPADKGAFRTAPLRNVAKTGPYMHTGGLASLRDVVSFYNEASANGGFAGTREAAASVPLRLSKDEITDLVAFLQALDGDPLPQEWVKTPALP